MKRGCSEIRTTSLQADVEALATSGGRMTGTPGHEEARRYLLSRMSAMGLAPYRGAAVDLPYGFGDETFNNLVGVVTGRESGRKPVLIGAHYDSVIPAPCADDNAAAVAIALSTAEALIEARPERDVVIALFDAEEPPHFHQPSMGSIRFFEDQRNAVGFNAAVIMDLVGHDVPTPAEWGEASTEFASLLFVTGAESHSGLSGLVQSCPRAPGLPVIAAQNSVVGDMSDHHIFRLNHVPYLFLSCGHWPHYHQPTDTPDRLNYAKMERIRDYLVRLAGALTTTDLPEGDRDGDTGDRDGDTTTLEVFLLKESLAPALPQLLAAAGLLQLETRADVDALVGWLKARVAL